MGFAAIITHGIEGKMSGEMIFHGYRTTRVEGKWHFLGIREAEPEIPTFDHSAIDIAPLDMKKPLSGYRTLEAVIDLDGLVPFDSVGHHKLIGSRGVSERAVGGQH
jgi:hypothetical protein